LELKIAFASCATAQYFPSQPVWTHITAQSPDVLVLLGDSVYFDVPVDPVHPQTIGLQGTDYPPVISFAELALARYRQRALDMQVQLCLGRADDVLAQCGVHARTVAQSQAAYYLALMENMLDTQCSVCHLLHIR
jgi:hypothetical protein